MKTNLTLIGNEENHGSHQPLAIAHEPSASPAISYQPSTISLGSHSPSAISSPLPTVKLSDGRDGVRALLEVKVLDPASESHQPSAISNQPILDFISSTGTLDRYKEIIEPVGWRLDNYLKNPVVQNAHRYGDVRDTIGKALITEVRDGALFQRIEFAVEANPIARIAYNLYKGGFLRGVSVGFIPLRWQDANGNEHTVEGRGGSPNRPVHTLDASQLSTLNSQLSPRPWRPRA